MIFSYDAYCTSKSGKTKTHEYTTHESPHFIFAYLESVDDEYMYFSLGASIEETCQKIYAHNKCDTILLSGQCNIIQISNGKITQRGVYGSTDSLTMTASFQTDSEDDYSCTGYVFNSLESAQAFCNEGDIGGVVRFPPTVQFPIKQLGYLDETQTFIINAKPSDSNRMIKAQIVDELTIVDFTNVNSAIFCYGKNEIDITNTINVEDGTVIVPLNKKVLSSVGDLECEIILKDADGVNILTTNTFIVRIKDMKGGCNC